jgi:hypothetical protein
MRRPPLRPIECSCPGPMEFVIVEIRLPAHRRVNNIVLPINYALEDVSDDLSSGLTIYFSPNPVSSIEIPSVNFADISARHVR